MKLGQQSVASGLSTDRLAVKAAGPHTVFTRTSCLVPSGIVVTISQSGSVTASFSSPVASEQQTHIEMNAKFNCVPGDILQVSLSSSASIDQPPNLIKTVIRSVQGA